MSILLDKIILFVLCGTLFVQNTMTDYTIVPLILVVTLSALNTYFDFDVLRLGSFLLYGAACLYDVNFLFFLPVIYYDLLLNSRQWVLLCSLVPVIVHWDKLPLITYVLLLAFAALAVLLKYRTRKLDRLRKELTTLRDNAKELNVQLANTNRELMEKQDYEIHLATLHERNRIAREIHDTVGHLLSSSLLQIGALLATCKEEPMRENLQTLRQTLATGMDSIRSSLHDLHDESIDLYTEVTALVNSFSFCPITLDYDMDHNPQKQFKYCFIAILKEALSNIIKHSDATEVHIALREHPALYQLVIKDNGKKMSNPTEPTSGGIGLKNIIDRVTALGGLVNINNVHGYVIFVSIPKE